MPTLSDKHVEIITRTALEFLEKEKKKQEKQRHDRRLRNVKLLLRNYRQLVKHCADVEFAINKIDEQLEWTLLDSEEFKLESIKRSKEKTLVMVKYINKVFAVYKVMCDQSERQEEIRRCETIHHMYINDNKLTAEEISELQSVAVRTVYVDIEKACKDLSVLMFGIDGLNFTT